MGLIFHYICLCIELRGRNLGNFAVNLQWKYFVHLDYFQNGGVFILWMRKTSERREHGTTESQERLLFTGTVHKILQIKFIENEIIIVPRR